METVTCSTQSFDDLYEETIRHLHYVLDHLPAGKMCLTKEFISKFGALAKGLSIIGNGMVDETNGRLQTLYENLHKDENILEDECRRIIDGAMRDVREAMLLQGSATVVRTFQRLRAPIGR